MNRGDRVTVRFDRADRCRCEHLPADFTVGIDHHPRCPAREDWPAYAGTVLDDWTERGHGPSDLHPGRTVRVMLDEDPPIIGGWLRDAPHSWWVTPEQVEGVSA